ncbi:hypothetical protein [Pseudoxanthomonas sp. PXM02]|uniref:hypothetical protein n=1 Tax=Pseudoxanthomonas sp. PXM02 TaxID=2769294 RepID=UPI00272EA3A8|nr:hypothetical protein [Pseudoxanthomonas sp. PXM02]
MSEANPNTRAGSGNAWLPMMYVHINPVKHGRMAQASDWPYSSIHRYIARGLMPADWAAQVNQALHAGEG